VLDLLGRKARVRSSFNQKIERAADFLDLCHECPLPALQWLSGWRRPDHRALGATNIDPNKEGEPARRMIQILYK
jgi:hypothetical protein